MAGLRIVVLEGDQTGQELLEQALRVIAPDVIGLEIELERFDLSLENRRRTGTRSAREGAPTGAMREAGFGIKAATITPEGADDVGSPNRLIREAIDGKVIVRTGRRIPGVSPVAGIHHPISVVRMAVEDAYGAEESRAPENGDEVAQRTEVIHRSNCRAVAEYAFRTAEADRRPRLRRPEVDGQPDLRGDAEGGDGRGRRAPPGGRLRAAADRRDLRRAAHRPRRCAAGDPQPQPRRRPALRPRPAALRIDRRRRVGAARARRRSAGAGGDERGAARHRARPGGQGHRQPDGHDPRRGGGPPLRRRRRGRGRRAGLARRSTRPCWRRRRPASARPT